LLVHFGPWGDTVDGQVDEFLRSDDDHDLVHVVLDVFDLFLKVFWGFYILAFGVDGGVDETIHVDVEVVDLRVAGLEALWTLLCCVENDFGVTG
jgi:hypothetical protein